MKNMVKMFLMLVFGIMVSANSTEGMVAKTVPISQKVNTPKISKPCSEMFDQLIEFEPTDEDIEEFIFGIKRFSLSQLTNEEIQKLNQENNLYPQYIESLKEEMTLEEATKIIKNFLKRYPTIDLSQQPYNFTKEMLVIIKEL